MLLLLKVFDTEGLHMLNVLEASAIQIHLSLNPSDSFFINNLNMTTNSVEKHFSVELNV